MLVIPAKFKYNNITNLQKYIYVEEQPQCWVPENAYKYITNKSKISYRNNTL